MLLALFSLLQVVLPETRKKKKSLLSLIYSWNIAILKERSLDLSWAEVKTELASKVSSAYISGHSRFLFCLWNMYTCKGSYVYIHAHVCACMKEAHDFIYLFF